MKQVKLCLNLSFFKKMHDEEWKRNIFYQQQLWILYELIAKNFSNFTRTHKLFVNESEKAKNFLN